MNTKFNNYLSKSFNLTVRQSIGIGLSLLILLIVSAGAAFWLGTSKGSEWADSKYLKEREARLNKATEAEVRADIHLETAEKLASENEEQKSANEAIAEKRASADKDLIKNRKVSVETAKKNAEKIEKERQQQNEKISNDGDDLDRQLSGLCNDLKVSGDATLSVCK